MEPLRGTGRLSSERGLNAGEDRFTISGLTHNVRKKTGNLAKQRKSAGSRDLLAALTKDMDFKSDKFATVGPPSRSTEPRLAAQAIQKSAGVPRSSSIDSVVTILEGQEDEGIRSSRRQTRHATINVKSSTVDVIKGNPADHSAAVGPAKEASLLPAKDDHDTGSSVLTSSKAKELESKEERDPNKLQVKMSKNDALAPASTEASIARTTADSGTPGTTELKPDSGSSSGTQVHVKSTGALSEAPEASSIDAIFARISTSGEKLPKASVEGPSSGSQVNNISPKTDSKVPEDKSMDAIFARIDAAKTVESISSLKKGRSVGSGNLARELKVTRTFSFTGLNHVAFCVENLERSLEFYCDLLGLTTNIDRPDLPYRGAWLFLGNDGIHIMEVANPDPSEGRPDHGGYDRHACLNCVNVEGVRVILDKAGIPYQPSKVPSIFCRDPDGNGLEFVEVDPARIRQPGHGHHH